MRLFPQLLLALFLVVTATTVATGENTGPELPSPDQVSEHYQVSAAGWPTITHIAMLALVAAEDRQFFDRPPQHSTITRQIGQWYPQPVFEKHQRVVLSFAVGEALSHDEILNWYANEVFLGQACFGLSNASMVYFGKSIADLSLEEIAYLAALSKAPVRFHPVRSHNRAIERRNFVLMEMRNAGFISNDEADRAIQTALHVKDPLVRCEPLE